MTIYECTLRAGKPPLHTRGSRQFERAQIGMYSARVYLIADIGLEVESCSTIGGEHAEYIANEAKERFSALLDEAKGETR